MQAFAVTNRYLKTRAAQDSVDALATLAAGVLPVSLGRAEVGFAQTAWAYFHHFADPKTGLCPATDQTDIVSPWEIGSTLIGILCADRLDLITTRQARDRLSLCLQSVASLKTSKTAVPGLGYCNRTLRPVDFSGNPTNHVTGWSARQIMRLVGGFIAIAHHYPDLAPEVSMTLNRWQLGHLLNAGHFRPSEPARGDAQVTPTPEHLGYEQYAARIACLVGLPVQAAMDLRPILCGHRHGDLLLPADKRRGGRAPPIITSDPFHLDAMEFGWRPDMLDVAASLFLAQKGRFEQTGVLTALTEDATDQPPGFAIGGLLARDLPFACISPSGGDLAHLRSVSTKAAFGWWSLLPTPYSQKLLDAVSDLQTPTGWQTGFYEASGAINSALSLNTNAVILEALHYRAFGPLFRAAQ